MEYDPYKKNTKRTQNKKQTMSITRETVEDVLGYPCLAIDERGITKKTAQHFGIRTALDEKKKPSAHYFPYTIDGKVVGFKKRDLTLPKAHKYHFTSVGMTGKDCELFGSDKLNKTGGKKIWITEGEYDAAIIWQILKESYPKGNPNVTSVGTGTATAVKHIGNKANLKKLKKFKEIIIAFDADKATPTEKAEGIVKGKEATNQVYGLIPEMLVVNFPDELDACETYRELSSEEFYWLLMKPVQYTPEGFVKIADVREKAIEMPTLGRPWPWKGLTRKTLGRRLGEGIYLGSGTKMGKSTFMDTLVEFIGTEVDENNNKRKSALFKFEENPEETLKKVAAKFYRKDFNNPERVLFVNKTGEEVDIWGDPIVNRDLFFTQEELTEAVDSVGDGLILYNNYGRCHWDELKGAIRHAVLVENCIDIFIDPITRLTSGMSSSETNTELERFADEISKMAQDLGFTYYCFCHLKAPQTGSPHEEGGKIRSIDFKGSRAMQQACHYFFGLEGNKKLGGKLGNKRTIVGLEDRKYGRSFSVDLFYDQETGAFVEMPQEFWDHPTCQSIREWENRDPDEEIDYGENDEVDSDF